jgi:hypothetical protein
VGRAVRRARRRAAPGARRTGPADRARGLHGGAGARRQADRRHRGRHRRPDDEQAYLPDLEAAGYDLRVRQPQHRCLRAGDPDGPVNLHCYPPDHAETRKYLVFRDRLRSNPDDRERYERVKRELAQREWRDINYYAEAKGPTIREILTRAGWTES